MLKSFVRRPAIVGSTRAILGAAAVVGIALAAGASANADTIKETFTFPDVFFVGSVFGSIFPAFDPALGTLNSVTYDVSGTSTFSGGDDSQPHPFIYFIDFQGPNGLAEEQAIGAAFGNSSGVASLTTTISDPFLGAFFGLGSVTPSVTVSFGGGASISSVFATESVTYSYTPATPAAPEPSTWAMMGLGFAALAFAGYRQTRRPAATAA